MSIQQPSLNIKGKSLVAMQLWCNREKTPIFKGTLAGSNELVELLQELLHFECNPDPEHGACCERAACCVLRTARRHYLHHRHRGAVSLVIFAPQRKHLV